MINLFVLGKIRDYTTHKTESHSYQLENSFNKCYSGLACHYKLTVPTIQTFVLIAESKNNNGEDLSKSSFELHQFSA